VDKFHVLYFLEDRAHEGFIKALVERVAAEEGVSADRLIHDVRSARHGSQVLNQYRKFLRALLKTVTIQADAVIVALDGNCKGYNDRKKELDKHLKTDHPLQEKVVYAIPDPHIERWYIMDQQAFRDGTGITNPPALPSYKCKKDYYKQILTQALVDSNIHSLLGGAEYAEKIVGHIKNLETFASKDASAQFFIRDLKTLLRQKW